MLSHKCQWANSLLIVPDSLMKIFKENFREQLRKNHIHHKTRGGQSPNKHKANIIKQGQTVAREEKFKAGRVKTLTSEQIAGESGMEHY